MESHFEFEFLAENQIFHERIERREYWSNYVMESSFKFQISYQILAENRKFRLKTDKYSEE